MKLSICIIVKNRQDQLRTCLDSLLPFTREDWCDLAILDTGSSDKTLEVASSYTNNVDVKSFDPWDFSKARNYNISMSRGEKIFIIDSDERLAQNSVGILRAYLSSDGYDKYKTTFLSIHNYSEETLSQVETVLQPRIFSRLKGNLYSGDVHNKPIIEQPSCVLENVIIDHYGYLFSREDLLNEKVERSLPMLEKRYMENESDIHILTHLIKTLHLVKNFVRVDSLGKKWIDLMDKTDTHDGWYAYYEVFTYLVIASINNGDLGRAIAIRDIALRYMGKTITINFVIGRYLVATGQNDLATYYLEEGIMWYDEKKTDNEKLLPSSDEVYIPNALNFLSRCAFVNGRYDIAGKLLNRGIVENGNKNALRWDIWNHPDALDNVYNKKAS